MTEFNSGTYFEAEGQRGWLEGAGLDEARVILKRHSESKKNIDAPAEGTIVEPTGQQQSAAKQKTKKRR